MTFTKTKNNTTIGSETARESNALLYAFFRTSTFALASLEALYSVVCEKGISSFFSQICNSNKAKQNSKLERYLSLRDTMAAKTKRIYTTLDLIRKGFQIPSIMGGLTGFGVYNSAQKYNVDRK